MIFCTVKTRAAKARVQEETSQVMWADKGSRSAVLQAEHEAVSMLERGMGFL